MPASPPVCTHYYIDGVLSLFNIFSVLFNYLEIRFDTCKDVSCLWRTVLLVADICLVKRIVVARCTMTSQFLMENHSSSNFIYGTESGSEHCESVARGYSRNRCRCFVVSWRDEPGID